MKPKHAWMVRAGNTNELAPYVETKQAVAIGWWELGDLSNLTTKSLLEQQFVQVFGNRDGKAIGQIDLFRNEIGVGDYVLTYIRADREYAVGVASSGYEYDLYLFSNEGLSQSYPHIQRVDWIKRIHRDVLPESIQNVLNLRPTVFPCDKALDDIHDRVIGEKPSYPPPPLLEVINFEGFIYAPVNEQEVVVLFGMMFHRLGFGIESVQTKFPDCGARRYNPKNNRWQKTWIEFEYKSSHFQSHGHNPDECDLIVCWIHDWPDCPLEVLELRSQIQYLSNR